MRCTSENKMMEEKLFKVKPNPDLVQEARNLIEEFKTIDKLSKEDREKLWAMQDKLYLQNKNTWEEASKCFNNFKSTLILPMYDDVSIIFIPNKDISDAINDISSILEGNRGGFSND